MSRPGKKIWTYRGTELVAVEERTHAKSPERVAAFLAAFAETGQVAKACRAVGIGRMTAYHWRDNDEEFAQMWEEAKQLALGALEDEAIRRGFDGVDEPVFHKGQPSFEVEPLLDGDGLPVLTAAGSVVMVPRRDEQGAPIPYSIKRYSDSMAQFMLKALDPEKYRERTSTELSGPGGGPIQQEQDLRPQYTKEEWLAAHGITPAPEHNSA